MTMMPRAQITPDQDAVVTEIDIAAPPERVFQALTDPAQLMLWWVATPQRRTLGDGRASGWQMAIRIDRSQWKDCGKWSTQF